MDTLRTIVLVLHISAAAVLIGANTGVLRNLRRTLALSREAFVLATEDLARRGKILSICSGLTLVTGLALIMMMGGMGAAPLNYHIALVLLLISMIISLVVMKPTGRKLNGLGQKSPVDQESAAILIRKLQWGQGTMHFLWLSTLILMLVRIYK